MEQVNRRPQDTRFMLQIKVDHARYGRRHFAFVRPGGGNRTLADTVAAEHHVSVEVHIAVVTFQAKVA